MGRVVLLEHAATEHDLAPLGRVEHLRARQSVRDRHHESAALGTTLDVADRFRLVDIRCVHGFSMNEGCGRTSRASTVRGRLCIVSRAARDERCFKRGSQGGRRVMEPRSGALSWREHESATGHLEARVDRATLRQRTQEHSFYDEPPRFLRHRTADRVFEMQPGGLPTSVASDDAALEEFVTQSGPEVPHFRLRRPV